MPITTRRILWFALVFSTVIYLVVLRVAAPTPSTPPDPMMPIVLGICAIGSLAVSVFLPRQVRNQGFVNSKFEFREVGTFADLPAGTRIFENPNAVRQRAAVILNTTFILAMALREAVALFGFVLGFLGHPLHVVLGFFVVTWAAMAIEFPSQEADDRVVEAATGIRFPPSN